MSTSGPFIFMFSNTITGLFEIKDLLILKEINAIMVEIVYPKNYYSHLKLAASDTTKTYRNCTIGHWNSEAEYKAIHEHPKFKAWTEKNKGNNAVFISGQLYRKFYAD